MKKVLALARTESLLVVVIRGEAPPSDAEWDRYLDAGTALYKERGDCLVLIVSEGAAPTSSQRHRTMERLGAVGSRFVRVALLTESAFVRAVVNLFVAMERSWVGAALRTIKRAPEDFPFNRAFAKHELRDALTWLKVPPSREGEVRRVIAEFEAELAQGAASLVG